MQSCLTDLPAIQTGMLVVSAVTFHSTGSEVRPPPTAAAVKLCASTENFSLHYCYLLWPFQIGEVEALPLIAATGAWLCHDLWWRSCAAFVFPTGAAPNHCLHCTNTPEPKAMSFNWVLQVWISNLVNVELQNGLVGWFWSVYCNRSLQCQLLFKTIYISEMSLKGQRTWCL